MWKGQEKIFGTGGGGSRVVNEPRGQGVEQIV